MSDSMDNIDQRSPEQKRALLAKLLKEKAQQKITKHLASDGQRAMWYIHQTDPKSSAYHVAFSARIRSKVNVTNFQQALQAVVNRHATLRTNYSLEEDHLLQIVHHYQEAEFHQVDASRFSEDELYQQVIQAYRLPFNLETDPVARWWLFTRTPEDHVFLITIHHIAVDAWSLWIILDTLRQALEAQLTSMPIDFSAPPPTYSSWASWQKEMLASSTGEEHRDFWQNQLAGELPTLNLPLDFPRPKIQTYNGASLTFTISPELSRLIKEMAQAKGVTVYMYLLAVYQILLYRYTGQEDILVGTPTAGRNQPEYQKTVGYFVNPVTLRGNLSGSPNFDTHLAQVKQTVLDALSHQDYPFIRVVENLHVRQDPSRSPVFQCLFNLHSVQRVRQVSDLLTQTSSGNPVDFGGLQFESYFFPQEEGQFELTLEIIDAGETFVGTLRYHQDLFRIETAERLQHSFELLLSAILQDPQRSVAEYPVIADQEYQQILVDWNQTARDYERSLSAHQLFEAQVERTPNSIAVIGDDQTLTYQQLNAKANQLAHYLQSLGIVSGHMVGVYLERTAEMVIAVLGILKAGGTYVPMDPIFPPQRIGYMIEDCQMSTIITQNMLADSLPEHNSQLILVDENSHLLEPHPTNNLDVELDALNLAYVIFTSGSTGRPKGVEIPHRALVNFLQSMQAQPGIQPEDILASVTTLSFDISGMELLLPLTVGARVVVLNTYTTVDGTALGEALEQHNATILQATPATWRLLLETGWKGKADLKMLCGGEALPLPLVKELIAKGKELWNMYGPTETTIWSSISRVRESDEKYPIGRPINNTTMYILDQYLQPVPIGVTGKLFIGGEGLARGYLKRPDLTAEKFITNPFANGRIYDTGDLARYLPDGRIECLGRGDSQVKIRGFRIELGEIETLLAEHASVQQAVVIVHQENAENKNLVAYCLLQPENPTTSRKLRSYLREKLPSYMIPNAFVFLDSFPLTPNGKIDRRALPSPMETSEEITKTIMPPSTPTEQMIADIWKQILHVEQIGIYDNFFDLGGHSLLAMQMIAELQEQTGFRLDPAYLRFESLGQLAVTLENNISNYQGQP